MLGKKKVISTSPNPISSLISAETQIRGDITFEGGLRIEGRVTGKIVALPDKPSTLVLSEKAFVKGAIHVSHAIINGTVIGPIDSSEYLELQAQAKISGTVSYKIIETQIGATVDGTFRRHDKEQPDTNVVRLKSGIESD